MKTIFFLAFFIVYFCSCSKSKENINFTCDPNISYSNKVRAIFVSNCASSDCHDGIAYPYLGDYNVAHDASADIKTSIERGIMPRNRVLSTNDKAAIFCWINNGSKNN